MQSQFMEKLNGLGEESEHGQSTQPVVGNSNDFGTNVSN